MRLCVYDQNGHVCLQLLSFYSSSGAASRPDDAFRFSLFGIPIYFNTNLPFVFHDDLVSDVFLFVLIPFPLHRLQPIVHHPRNSSLNRL